jgi:carbonic anhydrase
MPDFDDILDANRTYASGFAHRDVPGRAGAGVAIVTCMDSRIDPLAILGLGVGDAKILRNPGGQVTPEALNGLVLAVTLLGADRVMVIEHTRCAMASSTDEELRARVAESAGTEVDTTFGAIDDQDERLRQDVERVRSHPLIGDGVQVGGFLYDVDTGLLGQVV